MAGAQSTLVQQGGDLRVGVAVEQVVDLRDDALGGPVPLPWGKFGSQPQRPRGPAAQAHAKSDLGASREGDVVDQQPRHALALAVRGRQIIPQAREVGGQGQDALAPGVVELSGVLGTPLLEFPAGVVQSAQSGVPLGLQDIRHEPIVGWACMKRRRASSASSRALSTVSARQASTSSARAASSSWTLSATVRVTGVISSTSNAPTARSMPAPGMDWHLAPAVWMPSRWQT